MSNIIGIENLTKSYTGRKLFDEASFSVQDNEKIGIVGINGTGKSTLLRILAGIEEPDEGTVILANHVVVNYLPQNPVFAEDATVIESVMHKIAIDKHSQAEFYSLESTAKSMLNRMKITDFHQPVIQLSGGQRKRLALVEALLTHCDLLLLDEPTNHLDYDMVEWLETYLKAYKKAFIMITHDRYFLDSVCNRIVEIDAGKIYSYETNYSGFLELKAQREDSAKASERKRQSILRKEIEWMQRGARARSTKQKAHILRYEQLRDQKGPRETRQIEMASVSSRLGRTTIELSHICKSYENMKCIDDFSYIFLKNDRVGFVGKNGCGKTTLMRIIAGLIPADEGQIVVGQTVKVGYYCQEIGLHDPKSVCANETQDSNNAQNARITSYMNPKQRVIDYIKDTAEYVRTKEGMVSASVMLERFLFPPEEQYGEIGKLSGGERRRLYLLRVLMEAPNILILDEPTNDLDTQTLAILEDYLDNFDGIVMTVSHDRYFLDRIVNRIFAFEGDGKITQYEGGYTDYIQKRPEMLIDEKTSGKTTNDVEKLNVDSKSTWGHEKKLKFTYKEAKEYETIEQDIAALEEKMEELDEEMVKNATNAGKLNALSKEKEECENLLEEKMERWEYLEDLAEKIKLAENNK